MAPWPAEDHTPSPGSDMDTDSYDDPDDRTPSPYSDDDSGPLWVETPLVHSRPISARLGLGVYLKMEHLQPSQSFKYRGVCLFIQQAKQKHGKNLRVIAASSGNAALAAACASKVLFLDCTVFVTRDASEEVIEFLKREDAEVIVGGNLYSEALEKAKAAVTANPNAILVPADDDQILWNGYESMIREIGNKLDFVPDVIFCSAVRGGLLGGVIDGCASAGWDHVPIVTIEPHGSNCFYSTMALNMPWKEMHGKEVTGAAADMEIVGKKHGLRIARLRNPQTRVTSLGVASPSPKVVHKAMMRTGEVTCVCVPDEMIMNAAISFADEHKVLTELACAVTLTPAYEPKLMDRLWDMIPAENGLRNAVFIVCGGFKVNLAEMDEFRETLRRDLGAGDTSWECFCNGIKTVIDKTKTNRV